MATTKKLKPTPTTKKHTGTVTKPLKVHALEMHQGASVLYLFKERASVLFAAFSINRRAERKDEGYQRVLSQSRVEAVRRYVIDRKKPIPGAIIIAIDKAEFDRKTGVLTIPAGSDVGWIIDGQHRIAGAAQAAQEGTDIEFAVVAFKDMAQKSQVEQFITINREAKNVPTSLYLDLLHNLSYKSLADQARERATDLATQLRRDEDSPFHERIAVTAAPKPGQISLVNFVRKVLPHVTKDKGILGAYSEREQSAVIGNYFRALSQVFHKDFNSKDSIFFKTIGFGALWNVFQTVFSLTLKNYSGFTTKDVVSILKRIDTFDFNALLEYGTGNAAEVTAGEELRTALMIAFRDDDNEAGGSLKV